ncbi:MAG: CAP domain-containing protein [Chloroflexi bacterium]|nr:CAP domain-containing protein [Chloroflexota bacterium]
MSEVPTLSSIATTLLPTSVPSRTPRPTAVSTHTAVPPTNTPIPPTATATIKPTITPTVTSTSPPPPDWLVYLNQFRVQAGLPLLTETAVLSAGSLLHSEYMARNDNSIARTENDQNPFFTVEGRTAAHNGNIYATNSSESNYVWAINFWMSAPFHAVPILDPTLQTVGYGNVRDDLGRVRVAAVLDVKSGLEVGETAVSYPITFPQDGGETWILQQSLIEYPEPLTSCPGYGKPAGPPLIVQIGNGDVTPIVSGYRLWAGGQQLQVCAFDETTYTNPDGFAQERGRTILDERDAIVLIPLSPLAVGTTYTAEVDVNGETVRWEFTAVSPPKLEVTPIETAAYVNWYMLNVANMEFGGQTHDLNYPFLMQSTGMTWMKFQQKWRPDSKPEEVAARIQQAKAVGFNVMIALTGDAYPEAIDFEAYVEFLRGVAALDPPPDAIEVWNEMNIDFEWPAGQIDPAQYVNQMLAPAYQAIKTTNPQIMVISGAPAPTGFDDGTHAWAVNRYVNGMAAAGAENYMDCIGVHYNEGATSPYDTSGHPAGGYFGWYFQPSMDMYYYAFNGIRPVCITELGYLSGAGYPTLPPRFSWAQDTSTEEQGRWLAEAISLSDQMGYVRLVIVFNVDIFHWGDDPQAGFAIVRTGGDCPFCDLIRGTP